MRGFRVADAVQREIAAVGNLEEEIVAVPDRLASTHETRRAVAIEIGREELRLRFGRLRERGEHSDLCVERETREMAEHECDRRSVGTPRRLPVRLSRALRQPCGFRALGIARR